MIGERESYHGIVMARLVQDLNRPVLVENWSTVSRSTYVIDDSVGLYVKYSTKRLAPWAFEFTAEHNKEVEQLRQVVDSLWVVLVCGPVGIACESWPKVEPLITRREGGGFSLSVNWRPNHKFRLSGARSLPLLVADRSFPSALFTP